MVNFRAELLKLKGEKEMSELVTTGQVMPEGKIALKTAEFDFDVSSLDLEMKNCGFAQVMKDLAGGLNRISFAGKNFNLVSGGNKQIIMNGQVPAAWLDIVIIDVAPDRHCVWYKKDYDPRNPTEEQPDAVWWYKQGPGPGVPDYVINTKRNKDGMEVNYFQMDLRFAVALVGYEPDGTAYINYNNLYAMDISGMSLFSKEEKHPYYTFSGLLKFCRNQQTYPNSFVTRVVFAPNVSVPAVRFIPNIDQQSGRLLNLDPTVISNLLSLAQSEEVQNILAVVTKDPINATQAPVQPQAPVHSATDDLLAEADKLLGLLGDENKPAPPDSNMSPAMTAGIDELMKGLM